MPPERQWQAFAKAADLPFRVTQVTGRDPGSALDNSFYFIVLKAKNGTNHKVTEIFASVTRRASRHVTPRRPKVRGSIGRVERMAGTYTEQRRVGKRLSRLA